MKSGAISSLAFLKKTLEKMLKNTISVNSLELINNPSF